jgi:WD40 repeat protein
MFRNRCGQVLTSYFAATFGLVAALASPAHAADTAWIKPAGAALTIDTTGSGINAIAASSDGKQLFVDTEPAWFVLDPTSGKQIGAPIAGHRDTSGLVAPTASAARVFVTTWGNLPDADKSGRTAPKQAGELLVVDLTGKKSQRLLGLKAEPHVIAASADARRVALGFADGTVQVIDGASGKSLFGPVKLLKGIAIAGQHSEGTEGVSALAFSPDGARLAVAGEDVSLRVIDAAGGKQLMAFAYGTLSGSGTNTRTEHIAFTPDGGKLVTTAQDRHLRLHEAATGKLLGEPFRVPGGVSALAISADGKTVFTGDNDGRLQRWDLVAR